MQYEEIIQRFELLSDPNRVEGMERVGIKPNKAYGVSIPDLRKIAKEIGKNHELAMQLWRTDTRETRILACMIDDPEMVSEVQMDSWAGDFDYWEVCDQCCMCTELCPRYLLGHPLEPHQVMRQQFVVEFPARSRWGQICCECGICTLFACPEGLYPREACQDAKASLRSLLGAVGMGVWTGEPARRVKRAVARAQQIYGFSLEAT